MDSRALPFDERCPDPDTHYVRCRRDHEVYRGAKIFVLAALVQELERHLHLHSDGQNDEYFMVSISMDLDIIRDDGEDTYRGS